MARRRNQGSPGDDDALAKYHAKRDFDLTEEPAGRVHAGRRARELAFVIQKHAASHLHFDLRLEAGGVMKSWAVPKGPSFDPHVRRLAMQVEDHPIEYNTFEGTIPEGEYGGGTVMLWDLGTYEPVDVHTESGDDPDEAVLHALAHGRLRFVFHGVRLHGVYNLVRTRVEHGRAQWLLFKGDDEFADAAFDPVKVFDTSVATDRTMAEIAEAEGGPEGSVWHSNRAPDDDAAPAKRSVRRTTASSGGAVARRSLTTPMLATSGVEVPLHGSAASEWAFEMKYDGARVLAFVAGAESVALFSRNGNAKTRQFPEVVEALGAMATDIGVPFVIDGEIVALDADGEPERFGALQQRLHVSGSFDIERLRESAPVALFAFDVLYVGGTALLDEPWALRRSQLESLFARDGSHDAVRLAEVSVGDARPLMKRAEAEGWEGLIAKHVDASYEPGVRSRAWAKIKLEQRQEFAIGGWSEGKGSRAALGSLLVGYYNDEGKLVYAGHAGSGFTGQTLSLVLRKLRALEQKGCPFTTVPPTSGTPHWVHPELVAEVRFNEWTESGVLRHPVFVGLRDDKPARDVRREPVSRAARRRSA